LQGRDEEGNATGIKELVKNKLSVDYAIFGEPSGIDKNHYII
jgi:LysW-gamma-L-lysine carboxypeptidase